MRQLFLDERGQGLTATWHAEPGVIVLSIWRREECVGTVRLNLEEAHRLARFLEETNQTARTPPPPSGGG